MGTVGLSSFRGNEFMLFQFLTCFKLRRDYFWGGFYREVFICFDIDAVGGTFLILI